MRAKRFEDVEVTAFALFAPVTLSGSRHCRPDKSNHDSSKYGPTYCHDPSNKLLILICRVEYTNISTTASPTTSSSRACNTCTVTAFETFLTYPSAVQVDTATIEQTIIPLVTVYADGSSETNYKTVTAKANVTGTYNPPTPTDPYAHLTWEYDGATLTYPTTYVQFFGLRGGLFTPVITAAATSCAVNDEVFLIGTFDPAGLIVEVPATAKIDLAHPTAIAVPPAIHSFLNNIPAVSSQFSGTPVEDCAWTKIPTSKTGLSITASPSPEAPLVSTPAATIQKVTVSIL